jgi:GNAT superfamily N-acetyltransferase
MFRTSELSGLSYLTVGTALLQRVRQEHPTSILWEAADLQWWWRKPRSTDDQAKVFWHDPEGPVAAAVVTDWGSATWLDLIVVPSARPRILQEVFNLGLERYGHTPNLEMLVDDEDETLAELLQRAGFRPEPADVTAWMDPASAPDATSLSGGYSLHTRAGYESPAHPYDLMTPEVEHRLGETSLYRPDLDFTIVDDTGEGAAHALFWHDTSTGVGLIEPVGTIEGHRGKGLARHILTVGIQDLARAGSRRIKVSWDHDNAPADALYRSVGFEPTASASLWTKPTN